MNCRLLLMTGCLTLMVTVGADGQDRRPGLSELVSSLDLTERGAVRWLEALQSADGAPLERLLAVTPTGVRLMERAGSQSSVRVDAAFDRLLLQPGRSVVLIHNHPMNNGLSAADIGQLARPGVAAMAAIGHDGSIFVAAPGPGMNPDALETRQHTMAEAEVRRRLRATRSFAVASDRLFSHLVALTLAKAGVIEYWYVLRGANRSSFETGRLAFGQVTEGAASQLRKAVMR